MDGRNYAAQHTEKKVRATTRETNCETFMLRCVQLGIVAPNDEYYDMGDIYGMAIEQANDREKYPIKATQEDIHRFFG